MKNTENKVNLLIEKINKNEVDRKISLVLSESKAEKCSSSKVEEIRQVFNTNPRVKEAFKNSINHILREVFPNNYYAKGKYGEGEMSGIYDLEQEGRSVINKLNTNYSCFCVLLRDVNKVLLSQKQQPISFQNSDSFEQLNQEFVTGSAIGAVSGSMIAQIGSLITSAPGSSAEQGWGKLSGSLDEFRYWKTKRTDQEISRNWFTRVGGGTNTDQANTALGVYFKFNEGIYDPISISSYDSNILDYSGRISNGVWTGYSLGARSTDSAIILSLASDAEFKDPVVYSSHPSITALSDRLVLSGSVYDTTNNAAIYNSYPEWISDQDEQSGYGLKELTQIMAEFFDNLQLKIEALPTLKNMVYKDSKPLPFANKLLQSVGFQAPEIFVNSSILETFLARDENENFVVRK